MADKATKLLKQDHDKVRQLFEQLVKTTNRAVKTREDLLAKLATEIKVHKQIEEEILYPRLREAADDDEALEMYYEALEEHGIADSVLKQLTKTQVDTPVFAARAKVLKDLVEHHAEEEEKELFPKARKLLSREELDEIGEKLEERKTQLLADQSNGQSKQAHV